MIILEGNNLANKLRTLSDKITKRLWVAVPYIGSPTSVRRILGKEWYDNPSVSVKLLIDTSDLSCLNTESIQYFYERGEVKTLLGLHAKIYIIDDCCLVTSANLTNTAFSKRYEIGILYNATQAQKIIQLFTIWWNKIDGLLNYLYNEAKNTPSRKYAKHPRILSEQERILEIKKWAVRYKNWNSNERNGDDIEWRISSSKKLKKLIAPIKILTLTKIELEEVLNCLNCIQSVPRNRTMILNNNSIKDIRIALDQLVNGKNALAERMNFCNKIKNLGSSIMNEILGFTNPDKYPLINKNSNSGLRFFGYHIKD